MNKKGFIKIIEYATRSKVVKDLSKEDTLILGLLLGMKTSKTEVKLTLT